MRISDWSSDVCSSDLALDLAANASSRNEHDEIDGLGDQAPGNGDDIFRNELFDTVQRGPRAVGMDGGDAAGMAGIPGLEHVERSEEHTSELQSLMRISYAVFCLKKKQ